MNLLTLKNIEIWIWGFPYSVCLNKIESILHRIFKKNLFVDLAYINLILLWYDTVLMWSKFSSEEDTHSRIRTQQKMRKKLSAHQLLRSIGHNHWMENLA